MSENYLGIMTRIISGNYPLVYNYHMEKLRFIGILAYPKIQKYIMQRRSTNFVTLFIL